MVYNMLVSVSHIYKVPSSGLSKICSVSANFSNSITVSKDTALTLYYFVYFNNAFDVCYLKFV